MNPWLLGKAREAASDEATHALDFSDISKEFGGRGMEGMEMGRDGSRGVLAMGHDFACVSLVGGGLREARTVYARLAMGRKSKGTLHAEALSAVMEATGGRDWTAEDRGMDAAEHIAAVKREGWKVVVGDEVFPVGAEKRDRMKQAFKDRIANPLHRKALSSFLTQMTGVAATSISGRSALPAAPGFKSLKMTSTKGHDLFLTVDKKDEFFQKRILQANSEAKYELHLSDDGTKATITIRASAKLHFNIDGALEFSTVPAGTCEQQTEFDFDLSDPARVTLTSVRHGQTIVPPAPPPEPEPAPGEDPILRIDE